MSGLPGRSMLKFVTQDEVDETRKKRQEEWEKKRRPDDPLECPEEDNRSLYDRLQEQKQRQQDEYEAQHAAKNSVKGLEEDEANFLEEVEQQRIELKKAKNREEAKLFQELKASVSKLPESSSKQTETKKSASKPSPHSSSNKKSQQALLAGAVKRKVSSDKDEADESKKLKSEEPNGVKGMKNSSNQQARVIGVLPGLCAYDEETTDSNSSSSDDDLDFNLIAQKKIHVQIEAEEG